MRCGELWTSVSSFVNTSEQNAINEMVFAKRIGTDTVALELMRE